jgi:cardiolipin synthase
MISRKKRREAGEFSSRNRIELVRGGAAYFTLLIDMIAGASENIHLQTYIFLDDETGKKVADALVEAAKRHVQVFLMADGYASRGLSPALINRLAEEGVNFRFFEPLFRGNNFYFGRRLHHKLVVVDTRFALVGGINIGNHYNDLPGHPGWLDFAIFVEGEIAKDLCVLCCKTWKGFTSGENITPCDNSRVPFNFGENERTLIRMRRNDWVNRKNQISKTYIEMMLKAESHIFILCSYFLPGSVIRRTIKKAANRGVKITVIVAGKSDLLIAKNAEKYMYDWLLRNKVELFEYQSNILHGKMAVCDSKWLTLGSYNINDISAYASVELNLDVKSERFASEVEQTLVQIIRNDCTPISEELHRRSKNPVKQFFRWLSYVVFRAVLFLFTFYFKQRR